MKIYQRSSPVCCFAARSQACQHRAKALCTLRSRHCRTNEKRLAGNGGKFLSRAVTNVFCNAGNERCGLSVSPGYDVALSVKTLLKREELLNKSTEKIVDI